MGMKLITYAHDERVKLLYTLVCKRVEKHPQGVRIATPYHAVQLACGYGTGTIARATCEKAIERMYKHPQAASEHKRVYGACLRLLRRG